MIAERFQRGERLIATHLAAHLVLHRVERLEFEWRRAHTARETFELSDVAADERRKTPRGFLEARRQQAEIVGEVVNHIEAAAQPVNGHACAEGHRP